MSVWTSWARFWNHHEFGNRLNLILRLSFLSQFRAVSAVTATPSVAGHSFTSSESKYTELLARYYVVKRQHLLAAHVLLALAERRSSDSGDVPTLEQRRQYLINDVLQAKNARNNDGLVGSTCSVFDNGLLELLEGKLVVLQFQMKIKKELEALASKLEGSSSMYESEVDESQRNPDMDVNLANTTREKAKEISVELKSFIVIYNEYALPFELWEETPIVAL